MWPVRIRASQILSSVKSVPVNYGIRFSGPVSPLTARRIRPKVGARRICQPRPSHRYKAAFVPRSFSNDPLTPYQASSRLFLLIEQVRQLLRSKELLAPSHLKQFRPSSGVMETLVERLRRILQRAQHPSLWLLGLESRIQGLAYACSRRVSLAQQEHRGSGFTVLRTGRVSVAIHRLVYCSWTKGGRRLRGSAGEAPAEYYGTSRIPSDKYFFVVISICSLPGRMTISSSSTFTSTCCAQHSAYTKTTNSLESRPAIVRRSRARRATGDTSIFPKCFSETWLIYISG